MAESDTLTGQTISHYRILEKLGSGGMGEVYRAQDLHLRRDVAIKVLPTAVSSDPDRLRRFQQEATAAAALNHPNILVVFELGTHEGTPFLVAELLEGETLREHIKRGRIPARKSEGDLVAQKFDLSRKIENRTRVTVDAQLSVVRARAVTLAFQVALPGRSRVKNTKFGLSALTLKETTNG